MLKSHEIISFPAYVWNNYGKYITEKELILLGHFQGIQSNGKSSWIEVAERMGYNDIGTITRMLNDLESRNLIILNSYSIDATPLYTQCLELFENPEIEIEVEEKSDKKSSEDYKIANYMKNKYNLKHNINHIASLVKKCELCQDELETAFYASSLLINQYNIHSKLSFILGICCNIVETFNATKEDFEKLFKFIDNKNSVVGEKYNKPKDKINVYKLDVAYEWWKEKGEPETLSEVKKGKSFV